MSGVSPSIAGASLLGCASHTIALTTTGFAATPMTAGGYVLRADVDTDVEVGRSGMSVTTGLAARTAGDLMPSVNRRFRMLANVDYPVDFEDASNYLSAKSVAAPSGTLVVNGPLRNGTIRS